MKSFTSLHLVHISLAELMKFIDLKLKLWSSSFCCFFLRECKEEDKPMEGNNVVIEMTRGSRQHANRMYVGWDAQKVLLLGED